MALKYVLMLENDSDDRYITQSTIRDLNLNIPVRYEYWSPAILTALQNDRPGVILLAYNTSPESVLEIVKHIRGRKDYAFIPIVVLTEELESDVIRKYYVTGVNTVIKKPSSVQETNKKIRTFFDYWFSVAEL
jgi:CheY-like chemotaxis protein